MDSVPAQPDADVAGVDLNVIKVSDVALLMSSSTTPASNDRGEGGGAGVIYLTQKHTSMHEGAEKPCGRC